MRPCVVIPAYGNAATIAAVAAGAATELPVFVVDDGSRDGTGARAAEVAGVTLLRHAVNLGKGAALQTGFAAAERAGCTHAITLDGDGQHRTDDLPALLAAAADRPDALWLGARDLPAAGAGRGSRFGCAFSNFWTFVATGLRLPDTQCGLRVYPLPAILPLHLRTSGYDFEVEVLVKAAWTGVPVLSVPVRVHYPPAGERVSHFRPVVDFLRIGRLNTRLVTLRICLPAPYLALTSLRVFRALPLGARVRRSLVELFVKEPGSERRVAGSVALGLFMGIAPFWGFQIALTLLVAHAVNASKSVAVVASNVSFPLLIPFLLYASLVLGRAVLGHAPAGAPLGALELGPGDVPAWIVGSFLLATLVAVTGGLLTFALVRGARRLRRRAAAP